jgi:hypothetical protein
VISNGLGTDKIKTCISNIGNWSLLGWNCNGITKMLLFHLKIDPLSML